MGNQDHNHHHDHDHDHHDLDGSITRGFRVAILLTAVTLIAEIIGGVWTNSLALLSDAAHVFMDLFALLLSLTAIYLAKRPASDRRTYGWHRAEVFASLINGATLILIAFGILHEAWDRIQSPESVKSMEMFIIATIGLVMNLLAASKLGLGAVWLGVHPRPERVAHVREVFDLPESIAPISVLSLGWPGQTPSARTRYDEKAIHWEQW